MTVGLEREVSGELPVDNLEWTGIPCGIRYFVESVKSGGRPDPAHLFGHGGLLGTLFRGQTAKPVVLALIIVTRSCLSSLWRANQVVRTGSCNSAHTEEDSARDGRDLATDLAS